MAKKRGKDLPLEKGRYVEDAKDQETRNERARAPETHRGTASPDVGTLRSPAWLTSGNGSTNDEGCSDPRSFEAARWRDAEDHHGRNWLASTQRAWFHQRAPGQENETAGEIVPARRRARVHGELINSGGDGRLVQPSTVTPPGVRIEGYWRRRSVHTRFWQASFQSGMRSMTIIVMLEID